MFESVIPTRSGYENAQNSGRSIIETTFTSLNERAGALASEISATVNNLTRETA